MSVCVLTSALYFSRSTHLQRTSYNAFVKRSLHVSLPILPKTVIYLSPCHTIRTHTIAKVESCSFNNFTMAFAFSELNTELLSYYADNE